MLSQDDANAYLEAAAADLKNLSYGELERLATVHGNSDVWDSRELKAGDETVLISTTFARFGFLRKRVSVEMTLSADGASEWTGVPCVYFERFESGRLYAAQVKEWDIAIFKMLPYVFVGSIVIGVLAVAWHLFLRARD